MQKRNVSQFLFTRARENFPALSKKLSTSTYFCALTVYVGQFIFQYKVLQVVIFSPYRGKLMDPYGSTTARHRFFLFVLGPILYVAFVSVSMYVRCTRRLISKKMFFCLRRRLQYLIIKKLKTKLAKSCKVFFELSMYNK